MLRLKVSQSNTNVADDTHHEMEADDYAEVFVDDEYDDEYDDDDDDDDKLSMDRLNYLRMSLFKKKQALTIHFTDQLHWLSEKSKPRIKAWCLP